MVNKGETAAARPERNIVLTRIINAPANWCSKRGPIPSNLRNGGGRSALPTPSVKWTRGRAALCGSSCAPYGAEYPMKGVFQEVVEPERLVFTNIAVDQQGNHILEGSTTVTFVEHEGKTKLTVQTGAVAMVDYAAAYLEGMEAGWTQSLESLEELAANTSEREIITTRVFDAPRELVFKAFMEPEHLAHWWGPKGFTNTFHEFDPRPGGVWRFVMHGPDGKDYKNESVFVEIVKPERIVFDHVNWPQFRMTIRFEDLGDKTRFSFHMVFKSPADCDKVKGFAIEGNEQNFDRLQAELAAMR